MGWRSAGADEVEEQVSSANWLSSLSGDAALEASGSVSTAVDLLLLQHMGTLALYFQHPRQYLLLAM